MQISSSPTDLGPSGLETDPLLAAPLSLASPPASWLRWTAFRYQLPPGSSRSRVTVWRRLRARSAISLEQGLWAVPHREQDDCALDAALEAVEAAGGSVSTAVIGSDDVAEVELHVQLWRACERIWDGFSTDLDRLTIRASGSGGLGVELAAELDVLRSRFADTLAADLVGSDASDRVAARLEAFESLVPGASSAALDVGVGSQPRPEVVAAWLRNDGRARYVVALRPVPTVRWCRAFDDFEAFTYQPSSDRAPMRLGTFVLTCAPEDRERVLQRVESRVRRFESTLGG